MAVVVVVVVDFDGDGNVEVDATVDGATYVPGQKRRLCARLHRTAQQQTSTVASTSTLPSLDPAQVSGSIRLVSRSRRESVRGS